MTDQITTVVILAAGRGSRMKSQLPKGIQPLGGKALLAYLLETLQHLSRPVDVHVVAAEDNVKQLQQVAGAITEQVSWDIQPVPRGTGDAVRTLYQGRDVPAGPVLVLFADVPLIRAETMDRLLSECWQPGGVALLSMELEDPRGYGRIMRDNTGAVLRVVEQQDATELQSHIREVNTGVLVADSALLEGWLKRMQKHQSGEFYLPDIISMANRDGAPVRALKLSDPREAFGANDKMQLQQLERYWQSLQTNQLMLRGVWVADGSRLDVRGEVESGDDVFLDVGVVLEGRVKLGNGVRVGPYCVIRDSELGDGVRVEASSWMDGAQVGAGSTIGPFARLRPGTKIGVGARVGNFVEVKNSELGDGVLASHLSYIGDAQVGDGTNLGAGTITCNYDGNKKHRTVIGKDAFIGSNSALVAPVEVGDKARVGAGSVITRDVGEGDLAVTRARQRNLPVRGAGDGGDADAASASDAGSEDSIESKG